MITPREALDTNKKLKNLIQVNFFETREIRVELANYYWYKLQGLDIKSIRGNKNNIDNINNMNRIVEVSDSFDTTTNIISENFTANGIYIFFKPLLKFSEYTKGNRELTENLLLETFAYLKKIYNPQIKKRLQELSSQLNEVLSEEEKRYFQDAKEKRMKNTFLENNKKNELSREYLEQEELFENLVGDVDSYFNYKYEQLKSLEDSLGRDVLNQMGWDLSSVDRKQTFDISLLTKITYDNKVLKGFLSKVGRQEELDENLNYEESRDTYEDVIGVKFSRDLLRILPSQLSYLINSDLKKLFYSKYVEEKLISYELGNIKKKPTKNSNSGKGPIILCLDTSSSMAGFPEELSKSALLHLLRLGLAEERRVYLIAFANDEKLWEYLISDREDIKQILVFLRYRFSGGTDYFHPLNRSIELIEKHDYREADILMISDGIVQLPKGFLERVEGAKRRLNFRIHSLIINSKEVASPLSDNILYYHHRAKKGFRFKNYERSNISQFG